MKIRRVQYNINYVHILTFKEEYKALVSPYFKFDKLRYGIDNENTIHESVRLIFQQENILLNLRKEGITFFFEGDVAELKNQNGIIKIFWDLFEGIKKFNAYHKTLHHSIIIHSVDIKDNIEVENILKKCPYFTINPFGKLSEFACIYEYDQDKINYKFNFGNYSSLDIAKHDLMPFKTKYNDDLLDGIGLMSRLELNEDCTEPTFSKFKLLLSNAENTLDLFKIK